jgi:uncharacterized protein with PIN domain
VTIKAAVSAEAETVLARYDQFKTWALCGRVFWECAHWQRLRVLRDAQA